MSIAKGQCIYRGNGFEDKADAHNWKDNYSDGNIYICRHCGAFGFMKDGEIRFEMTRERYDRRVQRKRRGARV